MFTHRPPQFVGGEGVKFRMKSSQVPLMHLEPSGHWLLSVQEKSSDASAGTLESDTPDSTETTDASGSTRTPVSTVTLAESAIWGREESDDEESGSSAVR